MNEFEMIECDRDECDEMFEQFTSLIEEDGENYCSRKCEVAEQ